MNLNNELMLGQTVELRMGAIGSKTRVERIDSETTFVVSQPTHKLLPILFEENEMVTFYINRDDDIYTFDALYATRGKIGNMAVCGFIAVTEVEKGQRRYSYRLPVILNVVMRQKSGYNKLKFGEIAAKTINLSSEGVLLTSYTKIPAYTKVQMEISLSEKELCIVGAEILRCDTPQDSAQPFTLAAAFVDLSKKDNAQISKYILHKQIEYRRKRQGI